MACLPCVSRFSLVYTTIQTARAVRSAFFFFVAWSFWFSFHGRTPLRLLQESVPFERVLGKRVGESLRSLLATKGVKFCGQAGVTGFT